MTARRRLTVAMAVALALVCSGCASGPPPLATGPPIPAAGQPLVYSALGASETAGSGLDDTNLRERYAWPQLFFNQALPRAATFYNFAFPGITTATALTDEVPAALAVNPDVVTVFFSIDDLVNGVSTADFETNLDAIVHAMRRGGRARVLVGNAPAVDNLPAFRACEGLAAGALPCPLPPGVVLPSVPVVDAEVAGYDAAITSVVTREGAILVDLRPYSADVVAHPEDVGPDGLHPSPQGDQKIAALFAAAYRA